MPVSNEIRRLTTKWQANTGWPQRLDWITIENLRGWTGQRFDLQYPIMAVVGENGAGKSTILQCAAAVYRSQPEGKKKERFASDFFPTTAWDKVTNVAIRYEVREGDKPIQGSLRKPTDRWRGNIERRQRHVEHIDLSRIQPIPYRVGYALLAKPALHETSAEEFEEARLRRYSEIMGRQYDLAKMATTNADARRPVPVVSQQGIPYSGFHQGAGETTIAELIKSDIPKYSLVLIDEIESSLHPRVQRRYIRDLANLCRDREWQIVLTTHSPYVLEELPPEARAYILVTPAGTREMVYGVSPEFAMSKMDDAPYYECDLYVEDERSGRMLTEILVKHGPEFVQRCRMIGYGSASVGLALGKMVAGARFPTPSCVFLDGDQSEAPGCLLLPGQDAPERVVFEALRLRSWTRLSERTGRGSAEVIDACTKAMNLTNHHEWIIDAANRLILGSDTLWQAMCAEWVESCLPAAEGQALSLTVQDVLQGLNVRPIVTAPMTERIVPPPPRPRPRPRPRKVKPEPSPNVQQPLFEQ